MRKICFQKKPPIVYNDFTKNAKTKEAKMIDIVVLFCSIDDFWMTFKSKWGKMLLSQGKQPPKRRPSLFESEIMTIIVLFHMMGYRNFYVHHVCKYLNYGTTRDSN